MALPALRARGSGAKRTIDTRSTAAASFERCVMRAKVCGSERKGERGGGERERNSNTSFSLCISCIDGGVDPIATVTGAPRRSVSRRCHSRSAQYVGAIICVSPVFSLSFSLPTTHPSTFPLFPSPFLLPSLSSSLSLFLSSPLPTQSRHTVNYATVLPPLPIDVPAVA